MVVKTQLILVTAFISAFLLTLQFIVLQIIVRRSQPISNPIWRTLYAVTTTAHRLDASLFIVDPLILEVVEAGGSRPFSPSVKSLVPEDGNSYCQILCQGQKITQLAALGEFFDRDKIDKLTIELQELGYTVLSFFEERDPANFLHDPLPLHVLVADEKLAQDNGHVILINVFHEKVRGHWWRGDFVPSAAQERILYRQGLRKTNLNFRDKSTLFAKTEVKPAIIDGMVMNLPGDISKVFLVPENHLEFVACNWTRRRAFEDKYFNSDHDREQNRLFRLKVKRILSLATRLLDQMNIPFWLSSGTLLGYYRSCDVIYYGYDVDIGISIKDFRKELIDVFMMNNLMLLHSFGRINDSFELSFRNEDTKLDIFFFYKEHDHVWNGGTSTSTGFKYKYSFPHFDLCWTEFLGLKVRIPCHSTLSYIEANYGKQWFHPVREWDWKTSPPNVSPNGEWAKDEWSEVMQSFTLPYPKK